jgi:ionotropic glutamate receptor
MEVFGLKGFFILVFCLWIPNEVMAIIGNSSVSSRPSVLKIGALFTVDSVIGRSAKRGIMAAIEDVNANKSILPGVKLDVILHDTNCSGFLGTVEGICQKLSFQYIY